MNRTLAWREGRLVFSGERLSAVLAELSRYRHGRIVLLDAGAGERRVTGAFDPRNTDEALEVLATTMRVRVTRLTRSWCSSDRPCDENSKIRAEGRQENGPPLISISEGQTSAGPSSMETRRPVRETYGASMMTARERGLAGERLAGLSLAGASMLVMAQACAQDLDRQRMRPDRGRSAGIVALAPGAADVILSIPKGPSRPRSSPSPIRPGSSWSTPPNSPSA